MSFVAVFGAFVLELADDMLQATIPAKTSNMTPKTKILLMKSSCALDRLQKLLHSGREGRAAPFERVSLPSVGLMGSKQTTTLAHTLCGKSSKKRSTGIPQTGEERKNFCLLLLTVLRSWKSREKTEGARSVRLGDWFRSFGKGNEVGF